MIYQQFGQHVIQLEVLATMGNRTLDLPDISQASDRLGYAVEPLIRQILSTHDFEILSPEQLAVHNEVFVLLYAPSLIGWFKTPPRLFYNEVK